MVGDLADLVGRPPVATYADPDHPREKQVAGAALDAIRALLLENARLRRRPRSGSRGELRETQGALERAYLRPDVPAAGEKMVRRLQTGRLGPGLLKAYRRARGRSSRSA